MGPLNQYPDSSMVIFVTAIVCGMICIVFGIVYYAPPQIPCDCDDDRTPSVEEGAP